MSKIEIHDGVEYKVVDAREYVLVNQDKCFTGIKTANITAVQGRVGQEVETIMKNGMKETKNIVSYDPTTGEPDWIVTQATGEKMIVTDSTFKSLYNPSESTNGESFSPTPLTRPLIKVDENIAFMAPWGEMQYIKKGGALAVIASNDIYGIQEEEFNKSYKIVEHENPNELLNQNLSIVKDFNKPKIFLSIAYPHESEQDQEFMKEVIRYIASKGIQPVNVKKIDESNVNLVTEISNVLKACNGVLSIAFNRTGTQTSPFIHIETSLASALNLRSLVLIPETVKQEGALHLDNIEGQNARIDTSKSLFSPENRDVLSAINVFIEGVIVRNKLQLNDKDIEKLKSALLSSNPDSKSKIAEFLKAFYSLKDKNFEMKNVFVKRPTKIKALIVEESGKYETQDGIVELEAGDFLVMSEDSHAKPYAVKKEQFHLRYMKENGTENTYVSKFAPVVASKGDNNNVQINPLVDFNDKYYTNKETFRKSYETLEQYLLNHMKSGSLNYMNNLIK